MKYPKGHSIFKFVINKREELGISYPTAVRYVTNGTTPADVCLQIEKLSEGNILPHQLREDIFKPSSDTLSLARNCVTNFSDHNLAIGILNYLQSRYPKLYQTTLSEISKLGSDEERFVNQRMAHQQQDGKE